MVPYNNNYMSYDKGKFILVNIDKGDHKLEFFNLMRT